MKKNTPNASQTRTPRRTYSHLATQRRMPNEYELVTTKLHHHLAGFEVRVPIADWYERHLHHASLVCSDWERFRDPRETTYAKYTNLQKQREAFVDEIFRSIDELGYDAQLDPNWREILARVLAPSRFLFHGFQMIAAYVGQLAPSGRITIACAFQAADEMRRIQRVAYRIRQLQDTYPGFGETSRATWQSDPAWQPLRETVERLLVTYDWDEAFVALNLVVKPAIDDLLISRLSSLAWKNGDPLFAEVLHSLDQDCIWQRAWSQALFELAVQDRAENRDIIEKLVDRWQPRARNAKDALAAILGPMTP